MAAAALDKEHRAIAALAHLLEEAKRTRDLWIDANMGIPEPLRRLLGENSHSSVTAVPPPPPPPIPPNVGDDWVWLPGPMASPTTLVLAVLEAGGVQRARDVSERVCRLRPGTNSGSVINIGSRLHASRMINITDDGWSLANTVRAPILHHEHVWAPADVFSNQDLAAHRRLAIRHVLRHHADGLQTMQLLAKLEECRWVRAPLNKTVLKADLEFLDREGAIKRIGNSKKWRLTEGP